MVRRSLERGLFEGWFFTGLRKYKPRGGFGRVEISLVDGRKTYRRDAEYAENCCRSREGRFLEQEKFGRAP